MDITTNKNRKVERLIILFTFLTFISYLLLRILYPVSYSVINLLVDNMNGGGFSDTLGQIRLGKDLFSGNPTPHIPVPTLIWLYKLIPLNNPILVLLVFFIIYITLVLLIYFKSGKKIELLLLFSLHPFVFSIYRGSFDHIVVLMAGVSLIYYLKSEYKKSYFWFLLSFIIKPGHGILLSLLLYTQKKFIKNTLIIISIILSATIIIYFTIPIGYEKFQILSSSLKQYKNDYIIGDGGLLFNNSVYSIIKVASYLVEVSDESRIRMLEYSLLTISGLFFISSFLVVFNAIYRNCSLYQTILNISLILVFLIPISPDYRLCYLSLPIFYIVLNNSLSNKQYIDSIILLVMMLPKSYLVLKIGPHANDLALSSILNPVIFIATIFFLMREKK
jgi:hypothetical protein